MAVTVTAADLDDLALRWFVKEDNTDWLPGTDDELSTESSSPIKPRVGSLSQDLQDDLVAQIDHGVNSLR